MESKFDEHRSVIMSTLLGNSKLNFRKFLASGISHTECKKYILGIHKKAKQKRKVIANLVTGREGP
jgi:hypothetical protein